MKEILEHVRFRSDDEPIAPVTILDAQGRVVRVLAAEEFRTTHPLDGASRAPATEPSATTTSTSGSSEGSMTFSTSPGIASARWKWSPRSWSIQRSPKQRW